MQKRGPRTHYSAAQKGTATGDWVEGVSPVGPTTSKGIVPVGQPLKAAACVRVLTKLRLSSFSTMWNFAENFAPKADGGQAQAFSSEYGESPPLRAQP